MQLIFIEKKVHAPNYVIFKKAMGSKNSLENTNDNLYYNQVL